MTSVNRQSREPLLRHAAARAAAAPQVGRKNEGRLSTREVLRLALTYGLMLLAPAAGAARLPASMSSRQRPRRDAAAALQQPRSGGALVGADARAGYRGLPKHRRTDGVALNGTRRKIVLASSSYDDRFLEKYHGRLTADAGAMPVVNIIDGTPPTIPPALIARTGEKTKAPYVEDFIRLHTQDHQDLRDVMRAARNPAGLILVAAHLGLFSARPGATTVSIVRRLASLPDTRRVEVLHRMAPLIGPGATYFDTCKTIDALMGWANGGVQGEGLLKLIGDRLERYWPDLPSQRLHVWVVAADTAGINPLRALDVAFEVSQAFPPGHDLGGNFLDVFSHLIRKGFDQADAEAKLLRRICPRWASSRDLAATYALLQSVEDHADRLTFLKVLADLGMPLPSAGEPLEKVIGTYLDVYREAPDDLLLRVEKERAKRASWWG